MVNKVTTATVIGLDAYLVSVETDVLNGLPGFSIVGLPDASINEARDRVRSAIKNSGFTFPAKKVVINLAPADLKKEGAKDIYVCAVHPVFSGPAIERLANAPIKECIVTNTIPLDMDKMPPNIKQLSVAPLLGTAIARIHDDESVSSLFGFEKDMQVQ